MCWYQKYFIVFQSKIYFEKLPPPQYQTPLSLHQNIFQLIPHLLEVA